MPSILILGANSDIARAVALAFGQKGWEVHLAARNQERLAKLAQDLSLRLGRPVGHHHFDALDPLSRLSFWSNLPQKPEAILCAVGLLGDQKAAQTNPALAEEILVANFSGLTPVLEAAASTMVTRGQGLIIGLSSVAGDRGRASNYFYGSAKAAFTAYLSGLRNRLAGQGVQVITVKPGFVRTAMTEDMQLPALLTAEPEQVAADILKAVAKKRSVIYSRWFWRWIMLVIKLIPESIFKKLSL